MEKGIFIAGMEMPATCDECIFNEECYKCAVTGEYFSDAIINGFDPRTEKLSSCKLQERTE